MGGYLRNIRTLIVAACLLGASLLGTAALLGEPSQKSHVWIPMNVEMEELLKEKVGTEEAGTEPSNEKPELLGDNGFEDESASSNGHAIEGAIAGGRTEGNVGSGTETNAGSETETVAENGIIGGEHSGERDGQLPGGEQGGVVADTSGRIDINRATAAQLDGLKGIGPAKAQAIVDDREKNGPFRSVEELLRVKGIGEKLLSSIKESVVALP